MRCPHCQRRIGGASWNADPPAARAPSPSPVVAQGGGMEAELAKALRRYVRSGTFHVARCVCENCAADSALLARYDSRPVAIPEEGADSCWQETEHRLLMRLEAMVRQIDGTRRGCVRWPDVRQVLQELTVVRRGSDPIQPLVTIPQGDPGKEGP